MTAETATWYEQTFPGCPDQVSRVRHEITRHLDGCPVTDDAVLVVSELASNAVLHSGGEFFTVRCEMFRDYCWIECEDLGGEWHCRQPDDRPHGLDIVEALAGPGNWGTETMNGGSRVVWARLELAQ